MKLKKAAKALSGPAAQKAYAVALNEVGPVARNQAVKAVAKQMGVTGATIAKRAKVTTKAAAPGKLAYNINAQGGYLLMKDFKPGQSAKGVRAGPWAKRRLFKGSFIVNGLHGNVFHRETMARFPIQNMYGPAVPKEIVKDKAKEAFESSVAKRLPVRVQHQLKRATNGAFD